MESDVLSLLVKQMEDEKTAMKDALIEAADIFGAAHTLKKPFTKEELLWAVADISSV